MIWRACRRRRSTLGVIVAILVAIGLFPGPQSVPPGARVGVSAAYHAGRGTGADAVLVSDAAVDDDDDRFGGAHVGVLPDPTALLAVAMRRATDEVEHRSPTSRRGRPASGRAPPISLPS